MPTSERAHYHERTSPITPKAVESPPAKPKLPTPKFKVGDNVVVTTSEFLTVFGAVKCGTLQTKGDKPEWAYRLEGFDTSYAESSLSKA